MSDHDRFEREVIHLARRLRTLADDIERVGTARERHHGFGVKPPRQGLALTIHRQLLGALRDLDLAGLVIIAGQEDEPVVKLTRAERLDQAATELEEALKVEGLSKIEPEHLADLALRGVGAL